jgi:carbonic anhydrase
MSEAAVASRIAIAPADGDADIAETQALFLEYANALGFKLCFQGFDQELATLPGGYAPPQGRLLLARVDGAVGGVVGLRPLEGRRCEMRRLYVRPKFRGLGLGRRLAEQAIGEARAIGHDSMVLETLPRMAEARRLYAKLGFKEIPAYYDNPREGVICAELRLTDSAAS